jgi:hypothetical protein
MLAGAADAGQVLEVGAADLPAAQGVLTGIPGVTVEGAGSEGRLRIRLDANTTATDIARALLAADVALEALVPVRRNLEDVFMELTR